MTTNHRKTNEVVVPRTSRKVVHACRYDQWHAHFKKWTFESVTIAPLSDGDVTFLLRDEVRVMEKNKGAMPERTKLDAFDRLAAETAFDEDDELMDSSARRWCFSQRHRFKPKRRCQNKCREQTKPSIGCHFATRCLAQLFGCA